MKNEQWIRVKDLFAKVQQFPQHERLDFVNKHCSDPVVRLEIESLIHEYEQEEFEDFPPVDRFLPRRRLGSGVFGSVYEAYDTEQEIVLAVKVLRRSDASSLARFKREFWALRELDHPNLVKLYQLFNEGDCWFFSMQLIRGLGFLDYVRQDAPEAESRLRPRDLIRLRQAFLQLAHGIEALHNSDRLHRDIKPDNILVTPDGIVVLLDLGLSRELGPTAVRQSMAIVGTPHYLSPEQGSAGMLSRATDWYSFGVLLFEALTGHVPFDGDLAEIVQNKRDGFLIWPLDDLVDVPVELLHLCRELLQPDPTRRPQASEVLARLGETSRSSNGKRCGFPTQFIGRKSVLDLVTGVFSSVQRARRPVMVNLRGTSGIGKTTLLPEIQRRILQDYPDALVLSGRCHESAKVPFNALDSIFDNLTTYLKRLGAWEVKALLPRDVACLVKLFPLLKDIDAIARQKLDPTNIRDSQDLRNRGFEASVEFLSRLADHLPLLIQIDDVQWGDQDSATLLGKILSHRSPPGLLIIATYRSEDSDSSFLQAFETMASECKSAIVNVDIDELTVDESERLIRSLVSSEVQGDTEMISTIVAESARVPLLITEFANYANLCAKEGTAPVFTIHEVIKQRINGLPSAARKLLQIIAIAGQPVPEVVAYKAAELDADDFPASQSLTTARLIRVRESQHGRELEIYHDRYRQPVVNSIESIANEHLHRRLANALKEHRVLNYAFIATQFHLSGEHVEAARYYGESARFAESSFAFDQAAEFYRLSLEYGHHSESEKRQLMRMRATALVDGGRGAKAAQIFKEAACTATGVDRLDLERCAAEQFLRTGNINEGLRLVETVARTLGIKLRDRPWQIILSLLWRRCIIRFRGFHYKLRLIEEVDVRDLAILDTYWSLAVGLSLVDVTRASDFQARHLVAALRAGEPERLALSLALEAAHSLIPGRARWDRAEEALKAAEMLGRQYGFRRAIGMAQSTRGACNWLVGNWREAHEYSVRAEEILRENCRGANWELVTTRMFVLASLMFMGQWRKYSELLPSFVDEARSRGDRYAATGLLLLTYSYTRHLVDDQPEQARCEIAQALSDWSQDGFKLQDFWASYGITEAELYEGHSMAGLENVERIWIQLRRSLLLRVQTIRVYARHLWARCAVAAASELSGSDPNTATRLRKVALHLAEKNERETTLPAIGFGTSIRAAVSAATGASQVADRQFTMAENVFAKADMQQYAAASKWCRGRLFEGLEGEALMKSAEEQLVRQGARRPDKLVLMYAPGINVNHPLSSNTQKPCV